MAKARHAGESTAIARWKNNPASFISEVCRNPRTGHPYKLFEQEEIFLKLAFTQLPNGDLPFGPQIKGYVLREYQQTSVAPFLSAGVASAGQI